MLYCTLLRDDDTFWTLEVCTASLNEKNVPEVLHGSRSKCSNNLVEKICVFWELRIYSLFPVCRLPVEPVSKADNNTTEMLDSENGELWADYGHLDDDKYSDYKHRGQIHLVIVIMLLS